MKLLLKYQRSVGAASNGFGALFINMSLLRSFDSSRRRFYKYAAPTELWICAAVFLAGITLSGCSDSNGNRSEIVFPVHSKFFTHVEIIGSRGTGAGQFNKPRSLALDKNDNLFVVDMTGRVQKFSSNGVFLTSWQMPQTDLGKPKGMTRDLDGNIVVVEPHYMRVNHFSPDGKMISQWGIKGTNEGQLMFPRSVAVNSRGELFVTEYGLVERVQHFSRDGKTFLNSIGKPGEGAGEFNRAEGLGIDSKDQIYVADSCNHRVQIFSDDGKFLSSFGKAGSGLGELSYPYDVRVDAKGFRFVCEFGNSRVQIFDEKNQPVEILGNAGGAPGQFANPWSIDLDSHGNLYVADALNHRVQKFVRRERVAPASGGSVAIKTNIFLATESYPPEAGVTRRKENFVFTHPRDAGATR
ncbi:MAG: 6-bladed beta-propeller [Verrucomicrobiota bacterium]